MHYLSPRMTKLTQATASALMILGVSLSPFSFKATASAQEAPSKQFMRRNIPISWILDEWYQKSGNTIPMYVCVCTKATCDPSPGWPFRQFFVGETVPALGPSNKNDAEQSGFFCGQVDPKAFPIRGIGG